ncbi:hypothetical protein M3Y98_00064100 [Aphelenchoides besseyi]|nr:hypothetical protein M3Y98_00064100 [Aphelenchoides besseyi]
MVREALKPAPKGANSKRFIEFLRHLLVLIGLVSMFVLMSYGLAQLINSCDWTTNANISPKLSIPIFSNETSNADINSTQPVELDTCNCSGENFCFRGLDEVGNVRLGLPFNCSLYENLKSLQLLDSDAANAKPDYKQIVADENWSPVFVTSVSTNHIRELRNFVRTIRTHYPKSKIVIFDVSLQPKEIQELKSWCLVEYRRFDFSKYPPHVKKLMNYSFKLAIIEAFRTYKTFFYFDTSVRIKSKNLVTFLQGVQSGVLLPFSTHTFAIHSVYATTHPNMFTYLPLPLIITQMQELQSTIQFISDSSYTRYILKWWYLCATTKDCIDPSGANVSCAIRKYPDLYRTYINCHRFDQTYWNIAALAYLFGPERRAVQLNYTKHWDTLTENLIAEVEQKRRKAMQKFFSLIDIRRGDIKKTILSLNCHLELHKF